MLKQLLLLLISFCILSAPRPGHAETKVLTAEGTYTMGEGETMTFAESMALQKAKQMALEQAGTYVESYTKVQNYQLTADEIQTIAGGVLQVEVLDKTRTLVGDGLKFFVKIKATVTTDKVAELAQHIKGKNVAEEYKKLQEDYAKLNQEIEKWKQLVAKTPPSPERDTALDQIREREKAFATVQKNEVAFFQRLVAGETLAAKALEQFEQKQREEQYKKATMDALVQKIKTEGFLISIDEPKAFVRPQYPDEMVFSFPVTIRINGSAKKLIRDMKLQTSKDYVLRKLSSLWFVLNLMADNEKVVAGCYDENSEVIRFLSGPFGGLTMLFSASLSFDSPLHRFLIETEVPITLAKKIKMARGEFREMVPKGYPQDLPLTSNMDACLIFAK